MKGVILAAGTASRLRPLTDHMHKCLLKLGDQTILERTVNNLLKSGIDEIVIVTGYLAEQIKSFLSESFPSLNVHYINNDLYDSTNNIYSLWLTKEHIIHDDIILLDSDIVFDRRIIDLLLVSEHENCLALRTSKVLGAEEMKVRLDDSGLIKDISKEIDTNLAAGESIGIEKFSSVFLDYLFQILDRRILIDNAVDDFYEVAFQEAIDNDKKVFAIDVADYRCIEIDVIEDIEIAESQVIPYID